MSTDDMDAEAELGASIARPLAWIAVLACAAITGVGLGWAGWLAWRWLA